VAAADGLGVDTAVPSVPVPKRVDHDERRRQISDALTRVAASRGLDEVSLRHVAAEAGISPGMVQHYFRTKDEMMSFAMPMLSEIVRARLTRKGAPSPTAQPAAVVRDVPIEMLPLDKQRRDEAHVTAAFHAYTAVRPDLASHLNEGVKQLETFIAVQIRMGQREGHAAVGLRPEDEAVALLALVEGLGLHVLGQYVSARRALAIFDAHLARVFGPSVRDRRPRRARS